MNILLIETFLSVVTNRSITQAANQLYVSQSTVSSRILQLENEIGVELISRHKGLRNIELTDQGSAFVPIAQRYLSIDKEISQFHLKEHLHSLSIAIPDSINLFIFPALYKKLLASNPPFYINVKTHQSPEIYSIVDNHEADIGFVFYPARYPNIVTESIMNEKMYIIVSDKLSVDGYTIHPNKLESSKEVYLAWSEDIVRWHDYWWRANDVAMAQVDTAELLIQLVREFPSWALCPQSIVNKYAADGGFTIHESIDPIPPRTLFMLTRSNEMESEKIQLFKKTLRSFLRENYPY